MGGVRFNLEFVPQFEIARNKTDLLGFRGSKYVQAQHNYIYREIGNILKQGEKFLFIGTPCQVKALLGYIEEYYSEYSDNLFTVDILCHGVTPTQFFVDELNYLTKEYNIDSQKNISFRNNRTKAPYKLCISFKNGRQYCRSYYEQPYYHGFLNGITLRKSCYCCEFSRIERVADLTIGDFIGLGTNPKFPEFRGEKKNISIVLVSTEKGRELFRLASGKLNVFERSIEEAKEVCPVMHGCVQINKMAIKFRRKLVRNDAAVSIRSTVKYRIAYNRIIKYANYILRHLKVKEIKYL